MLYQVSIQFSFIIINKSIDFPSNSIENYIGDEIIFDEKGITVTMMMKLSRKFTRENSRL